MILNFTTHNMTILSTHRIEGGPPGAFRLFVRSNGRFLVVHWFNVVDETTGYREGWIARETDHTQLHVIENGIEVEAGTWDEMRDIIPELTAKRKN